MKDGGTLWCWGDNRNGQLGIGSTEDQHSPIHVGSDSWLAVSAGGSMTCAIRSDRTLWCWGVGALGQDRGDNSSADPVQVGSATDWATISVAGYACGTRLDGTLWCWGSNRAGELGLGEDVREALHARRVGSDADWAKVQTSDFTSTCAIKNDGSGWCWGFYWSKRNNYHVQYTPRPLNDASWISLSFEYGVQADGSLWSWPRGFIVRRVGVHAWTSVQVRAATVCGIQTTGTLWCKGDGAHGNLGHGTRDQADFIRVTRATNWTTVDGGETFGVGLRFDGTLWAWGLNDHGQIGDGTTTERHHPVPVDG